MKGVLVTCNQREKLCVREAYNLLNEVKFYLIFMVFSVGSDLLNTRPRTGCFVFKVLGAQLRNRPFWVYLGVKTCKVFLCFLAIIFLASIVLTS